MGKLGTLLNRKYDLSIGNDVVLYKEGIHPMMDYTCLPSLLVTPSTYATGRYT